MDWINWLSINNTLIHIALGTGYALSYIEAIAVCFGLLCIICASKTSVWTFPFGLVNVTLFACIFWQIQLYGLLSLQLFFFIANIYGWWAWTRKNNDLQPRLSVRWLTPVQQSLLVILCLGGSYWFSLNIDSGFQQAEAWVVAVMHWLGLNLASKPFTPDPYPFWDALVTIFSVFAQILMTRKFVENWILWIIVNLVSIGLYFNQGVYVMALQYIVVLFIAAAGLRNWQRQAAAN